MKEVKPPPIEIPCVAYTAAKCEYPSHFKHKCTRAFWIGLFAGAAIAAIVMW